MHSDRLIEVLGGFSDATVLVLGDLMLDRFVYGSVERISPEAPIPVMSVIRSVDVPGGAANVARNIAVMGAKVILLGVVGEDDSADLLATQLGRFPAIDPHFSRDRARPTTTKVRYVAERQQVLRVDSESRAALSARVAQELLSAYRELILRADVVVLSDYAKGVLSDHVTREAIALARSAQKPTVVDPKSDDFEKYRGATILTPNHHELQKATRQECGTDEQVVAGARRSLDAGICEIVVVTRGKNGMTVVRNDGKIAHLRTTAREVFDVSGAGDTAVAALSIGLAGTAEITDVVRIANLAAGIVVEKPGTADVTLGELLASVEQQSESASKEKTFALREISAVVSRWREKGLKIAFANGCFDILHPGHVSLLEAARQTADKLIVGLNSDSSVRRLKGTGRPVQNEVSRAMVLSSLKSVDAVVIFTEDTPLELIKQLAPDVLIKGADYTVEKVVGADFVISHGGRVVLVDIVPGHSTTSTIQKATSSQGV